MQGVFGNVEGDVYLVRQTLVQSAQQGTSSGQVDTVVHDVGIEFGWRVFERAEHGGFYFRDRLLQAVCYFLVAHGHLHRQCGDAVRSVHDVVFGCVLAQFGECGSHVNLDTFGHAFAHLDVVLAAHVLLYVGSEVVAGDAYGVVAHDASERDDGNFGRASAYVDNHVALRCFDVDADADGCRHGFEDEVDVTSAGVFGRVAHGTQFYFRTARRHSDDHTQRRREESSLAVDHLHQSAYHLLTGIEVGNHAVAQRADGAYVLVCLFVHHLGLFAHGNHLVRAAVEGHYRRLVHHNLAVAGDDGVGRAQVHCYFLCKRENTH